MIHRPFSGVFFCFVSILAVLLYISFRAAALILLYFFPGEDSHRQEIGEQVEDGDCDRQQLCQAEKR